MKTVKLNLTLKFSEELTNKQKREIIKNVRHALSSQISNEGLAPENSEMITESFKVEGEGMPTQQWTC